MKPIAILFGIVLLLVFVWLFVFRQEDVVEPSIHVLAWTGERAQGEDASLPCELRIATGDRQHPGSCLGFHGFDGTRPPSIRFLPLAGCVADVTREGSSKYYRVQLNTSSKQDVCVDLVRIAQLNESVLVEPTLSTASEQNP